MCYHPADCNVVRATNIINPKTNPSIMTTESNFLKNNQIDKLGNRIVADAYNNRIQKWTPGATEAITVI